MPKYNKAQTELNLENKIISIEARKTLNKNLRALIFQTRLKVTKTLKKTLENNKAVLAGQTQGKHNY